MQIGFVHPMGFLMTGRYTSGIWQPKTIAQGAATTYGVQPPLLIIRRSIVKMWNCNVDLEIWSDIGVEHGLQPYSLDKSSKSLESSEDMTFLNSKY